MKLLSKKEMCCAVLCRGGPSQAPHNTSSFIIGNADLVAQVRAELAGGVAHGSTAQRSAGVAWPA
jgi:hypothetical protein